MSSQLGVFFGEVTKICDLEKDVRSHGGVSLKFSVVQTDEGLAWRSRCGPACFAEGFSNVRHTVGMNVKYPSLQKI